MKKMSKQCPRLQKFHIPEKGKLEQWQIDICTYCIVKDICWEDLRTVPPYLTKRLKESAIPCPKCQATEDMDWIARKKIAQEIHLDDRLSTLTLNDDKDWECFRCSKILYQLPLRRKTYKKRSKR